MSGIDSLHVYALNPLLYDDVLAGIRLAEESSMRSTTGRYTSPVNQCGTEAKPPLVQPIYGPQPPPPVTSVTITLTRNEARVLADRLLAHEYWYPGAPQDVTVRLLSELRRLF